ncbi:ribose-phosphate pyrophosphokinase [Croceimicrobium hydrocarbonivorans]|uniref:ribose-phosphate diphosphokinase n=1 Tax=Croceimicrobium hydrocarbonivorans TaxID=2761580 RepID=A0A7H0VIX6_9FLAO|nr:ribose-phosphate pyrophosphokinase [Croceimicrobium hydrocarbonivorans]QNR25674.1 ribose-phosphate pyrophosphokinase [Croceimicrobium hydrocarbonivorans]
MTPQAKIFATRSSMKIAQKMADAYGSPLGKVEINEFSDGEFQPSFEETVRGGRVFLVGSTMQPSDNLMELLLMCDAAKRASAKHITVVMPYFGWARQDRKDKSRVPIGAKMVANLLMAAGATRIMTMDLHADQIQGFFEVPVDHVFASSIFVPHIKGQKLEDLTIASPDMGGSKRANNYAKWLESEVVICYKQRKKANVIDKMTVIGEVEGRNVVLIDDMVDTAGTLTKAADMLLAKGAKSVQAYCTHGVLSGKAIERIEKSKLSRLVITDTIPQEHKSEKIEVLSIAELFAGVMHKVHHHESISSHFLEN